MHNRNTAIFDGLPETFMKMYNNKYKQSPSLLWWSYIFICMYFFFDNDTIWSPIFSVCYIRCAQSVHCATDGSLIKNARNESSLSIFSKSSFQKG